MEQAAKDILQESAALTQALASDGSSAPSSIAEVAKEMIAAYKKRKKVLACGNGGSASQAEHLVAELVGRFSRDRPPLNAVALTTNTATLTAVANDYGYEQVFSRQVMAAAREGDILVVISTSGNSENILQALRAAKEQGCLTVALLGRDGGRAKGVADHEIVIPGSSTPRIQEAHIAIIHCLCALIEKELFPAG